MNLLWILILTIIFSLTLNILFFSKKHISTSENIIFSILLITNFFGLLMELFTKLFTLYFSKPNQLVYIFTRIYLIYIIMFFSVFNIYVLLYCINNKEKYVVYYKTSNIIFYILSFISVFLPVSIKKGYATGIAVNYMYLVTGITTCIWILLLIKYFDKTKFSKTLPLLLLITFGSLAGLIQFFNPSITLATCLHFYVLFIMYHTIENPDLKILNEYTQNKELVENNIESKINMLFKVSEDVKSPLKNIKKNAINILNVNKKIEKDDYAKKIYNESNNVLNDINEVFNVSSIDNSKVKIVDTTFNIYNLYDEIIYIIKNKINENTNFKYSITDTIPRLLYADNVRIKQIIVALLLNSISDKEGIIDLDIYEIVKNDICRLVIIVQSSYIKLDLNEINNILSSNVEISNDLEKYDISLKDIKKLIDVIGGTLLINDNDGIMNFKIIINEKIKTKKDADNLDLIANKLTNKKRVLLASDDYLELSTFTNILKNNNFTVDTVMYYKDITSKLNEKTKYDLLIIDDEMNDESAVSIIKEINKLKINHIIKIVLLDNDKELIKKHYLENNIFDNYIFKSNFKEDLKKFTTKYK